MKLVSDWKQAWKWFSVQAFAVLAVLPIVWDALPPDLKAHMPETWMPYVLSAVAIGGLIGRLKDQPNA